MQGDLQFDRIGDGRAPGQRGVRAVATHTDAIDHGDGTELGWCPAGMKMLWQVALGTVAGQDVDTCVDITGALATATPPSLVAPQHRPGCRAGRLLEE